MGTRREWVPILFKLKIMKQLLLSIFSLACSFVLASCGSSSDDTPAVNETITVSPTDISLDGAGSSVSAQIKTDHEWGTEVSDTWIKISPSSSLEHSATVTISAAENPTTIERDGTITIKSGAARAYIKVKQGAGVAKYEAPDGYSMVWHDEFNTGTQLDKSDWTYEVQPSGWVNNELQNYVAGDIDGNPVTEIVDGHLNINCFKYGSKVYSARVYAKKATGWKYGYVEARLKLPKGRGTWPAFWMMPVNFKSWPGDGEIDIMEEVGYNPNVIYSTIHCTKYNNGGTSMESGNKKVDTAESDYHVYAMEWTATKMTFYVDKQVVLTYMNDGSGVNAWPFDNPFYVIFNVAWGGAWGGQRGVDESALPITMSVDYIRVFQKK